MYRLIKPGLTWNDGKGEDIEKRHLISPEELERVVKRRSILLGYDKGPLIGFIGEHLEGSIGILYIFLEYRHRGFAIALQKHLIAKTMDEEYLIFTAKNSFDADQIIAMLEDNSIPAYKREHGAGQYLGLLFGVNSTQDIDIIVPAKAKDQAADLLMVMGFLE